MSRLTCVAIALMAGLVCVQAAGGIKGRVEESQSRLSGIKGPVARPPVQQQQYLPPPPPPAPIAVALPVQQAIKAGPGQVAPVFTAARVQPPAPPAPIAVQQVPLVQQVVQEQEPIVQQQQQQAEEIDPNAAAQDNAPAIVAPARVAPAAASEEEANPRPEPYAFQYAFNSGDSATSGSSAREEQQDASGRVTGFYMLKGDDGRDRRVDYVADGSGFRATISTNELGTANKDSADGKFIAQTATPAQLVQRVVALPPAQVQPQPQQLVQLVQAQPQLVVAQPQRQQIQFLRAPQPQPQIQLIRQQQQLEPVRIVQQAPRPVQQVRIVEPAPAPAQLIQVQRQQQPLQPFAQVQEESESIVQQQQEPLAESSDSDLVQQQEEYSRKS